MTRERERKGKEIKGREKGRERTNSVGVIALLKRKRQLEKKEDKIEEGERCFERSKIISRSSVRVQKGGEEGTIMRALEGWMGELKGKWERIEDSLVCIKRELEEMRRDWRGRE